MTVVVGIAFGKPSDGVGVAVLDGGEVVEAATILATLPGFAGCADAGTRAVRLALDILADHDLREAVWVVEEPVNRPTSPQQRRAAAARSDVQHAATVRAVAAGAVLATVHMLPEPPLVLIEPSPGPYDPAECPPVLAGTQPSHWRGPRGVRRNIQQSAWGLARPVTHRFSPATGEAYTAALAYVIKQSLPRVQDLATAADIAVRTITPPPGAPALTAHQVATWASTQNLTTEAR